MNAAPRITARALPLLLPTLFWSAFTAVELYLRSADIGYWSDAFKHTFLASMLVSFGLFHGITAGFLYLFTKFPRLTLLPAFVYGLGYTLVLTYADAVRIARQPLLTPIKFAGALIADQGLRAFQVVGVTPFFWGGIVGISVFSAFLYLRILVAAAPTTRRDRPLIGLVALLSTLIFLGGFPWVVDGGKTEYLPMFGDVHAARLFRVAYTFAYPPKE